MELRKVFKQARDPLTLFGAFNIAADCLLIASGATYNAVRMVPAALGMGANFIGLAGMQGTIKGIPTYKITLNMATIAGAGFIVSGSNVFGFEETMRIGEMLAGSCVAAASQAILAGRSLLGSAFFYCATASMSIGAIEKMITSGQVDYYMLGASGCFLVANGVAALIKRPQNQPVPVTGPDDKPLP